MSAGCPKPFEEGQHFVTQPAHDNERLAWSPIAEQDRLFMNVHSKEQVHVWRHKVFEPIQKLKSHQCSGTLMFDAQTWYKLLATTKNRSLHVSDECRAAEVIVIEVRAPLRHPDCDPHCFQLSTRSASEND